jgi:Rrf2 family protein
VFRNSHFALATHVLCVLAILEGPTSSSQLARSVNTHPAFLRGLLGRLKAAGLVEMQLGKGGGARLARPAAEISLLDVWRAVEPEPEVPRPACPPSQACPVGRRLPALLDTVALGLDAAIADHLRGTHVAELAEQIRAEV